MGLCAQADPMGARTHSLLGARGKGHQYITSPWSPAQVGNGASGGRPRPPRRRRTDTTKQSHQHRAWSADPQHTQDLGVLPRAPLVPTPLFPRDACVRAHYVSVTDTHGSGILQSL